MRQITEDFHVLTLLTDAKTSSFFLNYYLHNRLFLVIDFHPGCRI